MGDTKAAKLAGIGDKRRAAAKAKKQAAQKKLKKEKAAAKKGGKTKAAFKKALKKFGLAPGSHLSSKPKEELGKASRRRFQKPLIPPVVSSDASLNKATGAYHLGHGRRRIGAGFAHERKKGWKNVQPPHGKLPGLLRKEFPKIWYR